MIKALSANTSQSRSTSKRYLLSGKVSFLISVVILGPFLKLHVHAFDIFISFMDVS